MGIARCPRRRGAGAELDYYGVCCFGDRADLDPLTRKFSLVRDFGD